MNRLVLFIVSIIVSSLAFAQDKIAVVTLKNGTALHGVIKSINPTDAIKMEIVGVETSIKMSDVAKIEEAPAVLDISSTQEGKNINETSKLTVTDFAEYPETFNLTIGDTNVKMILVRGGDMNMGYDGRHSLSMKSEPVHKVSVTSFYLSETYIPSSIVSSVKGKKYKKEFYEAKTWDDANNIVEKVAKIANKPVRLPTEAEWEYAASSSVQSQLFKYCTDQEYCLDYYDKFHNTDYVIDPLGPSKGKTHVIRGYYYKRGKYDRSESKPSIDSSYAPPAYFRIAIKAKDLK